METPKIKMELKENVDAENGVLVHGFPGPGLSSSIAVNYIMEQLDLQRVGIIKSEAFPAVAVIKDYTPLPPMRLYGKNNFILLISEMAPVENFAKIISDSLFDFAKAHNLKTIISFETFAAQNAGKISDAPGTNKIVAEEEKKEPEHDVYVVGSTPSIKNKLDEQGFHLFKEGLITGVAGQLLTDAEDLDVDVICILTKANPMYPDVRAASRLIETLNKLESLDIDLGKINQEADKIEEKVKDSMVQAQRYLEAQQKQQANKPTPPSYMYR